MALRTRWWLPATTATAAVLMGTAAPVASAAGEPAANAGAPYVVEDGSYPGSDQTLAETGAKLIRGDGNITHTPCDKPYQIKVWARDLKLPEERMCFAAPGGTGFLTVSIPGAYRIQTYERSVKASISVKNETQNLDIPGNTSRGFGEAGADPSAAVLLELRVTGTSSTTPPGAGQPIDTAGLAFNTKLIVGDSKRSCSGALVDAHWVLTAKSCFADDPAQGNTVAAGAPKDKTTAVVGKSLLITSGGHTSDIAELVPHADRDLVMARLVQPANGIDPVPLAATAPATGHEVTVAGFGRTKTEWVPATRHKAVFTAGNVTATGFDLAAKSPADATVCAGDAGGAAFRTENGKPALVGITGRGWQGGCLGAPDTETRAGAFSTRVDDLGGWFQRVRALSPGWKTQALVQSGSSLYQGVRVNDGSWTGFEDVQTQGAGSIGGIRNSAAVGMSGDTHVLAVSNSAGLFHTIRKQDGSWGAFGDVFGAAGALGNLTGVTAMNIGRDLHVVAVADGKALHTVRDATGNWTPFRDVTSGKVGNVTAAATAVVRGELHVTTVSGGKAYHTIRQGNGNWLPWGDVAGAAGPTGPITSISTVGSGDETHIVIATDNGARQYHALRNFNGVWTQLTEIKAILGTVTAKSVATANVAGEVVVAVTTADDKLLHTTRRADRTWATTAAVPVQGLPAAPGALAITGTWNG
ncbi:trypsin-like serine protease [Streptomyces sp. NPDC055254]